MFNASLFCQDYGLEYTPSGSWININCPICGDRKGHGGININGYFNCWKCGGHSLSYVLQKLLLIREKEALEIIDSYEIHSEIVGHAYKPKTTSNISKIELIGDSLQPTHRNYLKKRGFSPSQLVKKYGLTGTLYAPPEFAYRIIIPIYLHGKLVSWQGRDITGESPLRYKALKPAESVVHYKKTLYGQQFAESSQVAVVEGVVDQWRMGDGFVATYGTALTGYQLKLLAQYDRVYFAYDPDAIDKAKKYAKALCALRHGLSVEYIDLELPDNKDPGDLTADEATYIRRQLNFF